MTVATVDSGTLEWLARLPAPDAALEAAAWLAELVADDAFLKSQVLPRFDPLAGGPEPSMAVLADGGGAYSLLAFHWPAGSATRIHDHGSWAVLGVAAGYLHEDRFVRLDEGDRPIHAHLRRLWSDDWAPGWTSALLPREGGIHRIQNRSADPAVSIHLYGPTSDGEGREYDPATDEIDDER
jgi:predicted metal-dependent enzyme (double-stranded beta helix superfamily)